MFFLKGVVVMKKLIVIIGIVAFLVLGLMIFLFLNPPINHEDPNTEFLIQESLDEDKLDETNEDASSDKKSHPLNEDSRVLSVYYQILPLIPSGQWDIAYDILVQFFNESPSLREEPFVLTHILNDLAVLTQMSKVHPDLYDDVFTHFEAVETFAAAMIYYPFSVKHRGFINQESLVPIALTNQVVFFGPEKMEDPELTEKLRDQYQIEIDASYHLTAIVDDVEVEMILVQIDSGYWRVYTVTTEDPKSYYIDVNFWRSILNM